MVRWFINLLVRCFYFHIWAGRSCDMNYSNLQWLYQSNVNAVCRRGFERLSRIWVSNLSKYERDKKTWSKKNKTIHTQNWQIIDYRIWFLFTHIEDVLSRLLLCGFWTVMTWRDCCLTASEENDCVNVIWMLLVHIEGLSCVWLTANDVISFCPCWWNVLVKAGHVMWFLLSLECRPDKDLRATLTVTCSFFWWNTPPEAPSHAF